MSASRKRVRGELEYEDFVPASFPMLPGTEIRINHCRRGRNKDKLYIKKCWDGVTIKAFCHHCGKSGVFISKSASQLPRKDTRLLTLKDTEFKLPQTCEYDLSKWPKAAAVWALRWGLNEELLTKYRVSFDTNTSRIVLPVLDTNTGVLLGYQLRKVFPGRGPKYTTVTSATAKGPLVFRTKSPSKHMVCVVCEDVLSAIHLAEAGVDSIAILSSFKKGVDTMVAKDKYKFILVWLDNDNQAVKLNAYKMRKQLQLCAPYVSVVKGASDPKHHRREEILKIINSFLIT